MVLAKSEDPGKAIVVFAAQLLLLAVITDLRSVRRITEALDWIGDTQSQARAAKGMEDNMVILDTIKLGVDEKGYILRRNLMLPRKSFIYQL